VSYTLNKLHVSTPGRICLFGEHQDYLNLPVIPCAISLRISIEGVRREDSFVVIDLPDIKSKEQFRLEESKLYTQERDYYRSAINVLEGNGFRFSKGFDCVVRSAIPINAGTSSSSALMVTWINFLAQMSDQCRRLSPREIAFYAHVAEVIEFKEPGGMMDQYATAFGGVSVIDFFPKLRIHQVQADFKSFVLGNSGQRKDTRSVLSRVKNRVLDIVKVLSAKDKNFSLQDLSIDSIDGFKGQLNEEQQSLLVGTIRNRDITSEAKKLLRQTPLDHRRIGSLLTEHQNILRDVLKISTPKIDRMIDAALDAGACGAKINGSGGGGCMFAYVPEHSTRVAAAIEKAGGTAYIVHVDEGTRNEHSEMLK